MFLIRMIENTASVLHYLLYQYWMDCQDPRTKDWFLIDVSPFTFTAIMTFYVLFAKYFGPKFMNNREALQLKALILMYNTLMVVLNAYFFVLVVINCDYGRRFIDFRYPDRNDTSPRAIWELSMGYWYWWTKFLDLLDTVFFVFRKKNGHISFLHLYHHTCVPVFGWLCLKHNAVMPATGLFGLINTFVHTIMYSYYALSTLGPEVKPYLWWKKYITQLQLAQFAFGIFYGTLMVFLQRGYPVFWFYFGLTQPLVFFYLFYDFYKNSYKKSKQN